MTPLDDDTLNGTHETYVLGTPIDGYVDEVGYEYKICWGHNAAANHNVDVGTLTMDGPNVMSTVKTCMLSVACTIQVSGVGLNASNRLALSPGNCPPNHTQSVCPPPGRAATLTPVFDLDARAQQNARDVRDSKSGMVFVMKEGTSPYAIADGTVYQGTDGVRYWDLTSTFLEISVGSRVETNLSDSH